MITHPDVGRIPPEFISSIHKVIPLGKGKIGLDHIWGRQSYQAAACTTPQDYGTPHEFPQVHTTQQHWQPKINQQAELDKLESPE